MPIDSVAFAILLPLAAAWLAGCLIGLEREYHGHPAGFRTHALVCLASALLTLVMTQPWDWLDILPLEAVRADPTRVVEAIMTGIGFLGAGMIFREGLAVRGLTTAASIWITAALGILYGLGYWLPAVAGTLAALLTLSVFQRLERWLPAKHQVIQTLCFRRDHLPARQALDGLLAEHGFIIEKASYALEGDGTTYEYRLMTTTRGPGNLDPLADALRALPGLVAFRLTPECEDGQGGQAGRIPGRP